MGGGDPLKTNALSVPPSPPKHTHTHSATCVLRYLLTLERSCEPVSLLQAVPPDTSYGAVTSARQTRAMGGTPRSKSSTCEPRDNCSTSLGKITYPSTTGGNFEIETNVDKFGSPPSYQMFPDHPESIRK